MVYLGTIILGCGGNAIDLLSFKKLDGSIFFVDDNKQGRFMGCDIIGTIGDLCNGRIKIDLFPGERLQILNCVGSVGDNRARNQIYEKVTRAGYKISPLIFSPQYISGNVVVGENALIGLNSQIHHDCNIGDHCVISPGSILCGDVVLRENVFVGAGSTIIQNVTIGRNTVIGAGSVVIKDCEPGSVYAGNPAKRIK